MAYKPKLSFLVPSRERADSLLYSVNSLRLDRINVEVLVWVDSDDKQLEKYQEYFGERYKVRLFVKPKIGYLKFHEMMNFLASEATGEWMILWNDDAYMEVPRWFRTFAEYASLSDPFNEPIVYNIWGQGGTRNMFPIISKKYLELVGHFAENCICDTWVKHVAVKSNIQRTIFGIRPNHRKFGHDNQKLGDLVDGVTKAIEQLKIETNDKFLGQQSEENIKKMDHDAEVITDWIRKATKRNIRVGMVGLGKLGLPIAIAIESRGKNVVAYDVNPNVHEYIRDKKIPFQEEGMDRMLPSTTIEMVDSIEEVVKKCDLVFCAVQTPHDARFEGDKPLKEHPIDFDYTYLKAAVSEVVAAANKLDEKTTLVVISTCLPGTYEREIKPLLSSKVNYVYNPFFIAMGTVVTDFLHPDFILVGRDNTDVTPLTNFYKMIIGADKTFVTDITTAEGIKVLHNSYLTSKIVFANIYGEMAHKLGMNADDIYKAFSLATNRVLSSKYLKAGVGTGGGCHPRDNIALSYIAQNCNISFNIFETLMSAREKHMEWLASLAVDESNTSKLPIVILGKAFKPESNLITGSPAILMAHMLTEQGIEFSHWEFDFPQELPQAVYVVATQHMQYSGVNFPEGSTVIDPFRYIPKKDGVRVVAIGGKRE